MTRLRSLLILFISILLIFANGYSVTADGKFNSGGNYPVDDQEIGLGRLSTGVSSQLSFTYEGSTLWNMTSATASHGNYVYAAMVLGIRTIDISNPASPQVVHQLHIPLFLPNQLVIVGNYLYVVSEYYETSMRIVDISNPAQPVLRGQYKFNPQYSADDPRIAVDGQYAYFTYGDDIYVINISNRDNPVFDRKITGPAHCIAAQGDRLFFETSRYQWVNQQYVAVPQIKIVDLANPQSPAVLDTIHLPRPLSDLVIAGNFLYAADADSQISVIDIANTQIASTLQVQTSGRCIADGDYLYVTTEDYSTTNSMTVINISQAPNLTLASVTALPNQYFLSSLYGNQVVLTSPNDGLLLYDVSYPSLPVLTGSYSTAKWPAASTVEVAGDYAFVGGTFGFQVIDVADVKNPSLVATYGTTECLDIYLDGNIAYACFGTSGLKILDVSNPLAPSLLAEFNTPDRANGCTVVGTRAFICANNSGLRIVDVSNPSAPFELGYWSDPAVFVQDVDIYGDYAYVGEYLQTGGDCSVRVLNISNPAEPQFVTSFAADDFKSTQNIRGSYLFVSSYRHLRVYDISNPELPTELSLYNSGLGAEVNLTFVGNDAYVANYDEGLLLLNLDNPAVPAFAGQYSTLPLWVMDVDVQGDLVYAAGDNGFMVFRSYPFECGDADGSGIVTISDAVYLISYIFAGGTPPNPIQSGDSDCNDLVTISDVVFLINYIFSSGPAPCSGC